MTESSQIPGWVMELTNENFLALYDVSLDIRQELQMSDDPVIPVCQPMVKFQVLMPFDSINMRDRYGDLGWKATGLLHRQGVIRSYDLLRGSHRWQSRLRIGVERAGFEEFVKLLDAEHDRRMQFAAAKKDSSPAPAPADPLEILRNLLLRFHAVTVQLRQRHDRRPTLDVSDEYDVQDLLHALLCLYFGDIRPEEWTPSYAGKSSRVDFLLKREAIVVEVKKTRSGLTEKELGDQLIVDTARYSRMPDCKTLVCFVYDPESRIPNPGGLEADLSGTREKVAVEVLVLPKRY